MPVQQTSPGPKNLERLLHSVSPFRKLVPTDEPVPMDVDCKLVPMDVDPIPMDIDRKSTGSDCKPIAFLDNEDPFSDFFMGAAGSFNGEGANSKGNRNVEDDPLNLMNIGSAPSSSSSGANNANTSSSSAANIDASCPDDDEGFVPDWIKSLPDTFGDIRNPRNTTKTPQFHSLRLATARLDRIIECLEDYETDYKIRKMLVSMARVAYAKPLVERTEIEEDSMHSVHEALEAIHSTFMDGFRKKFGKYFKNRQKVEEAQKSLATFRNTLREKNDLIKKLEKQVEEENKQLQATLETRKKSFGSTQAVLGQLVEQAMSKVGQVERAHDLYNELLIDSVAESNKMRSFRLLSGIFKSMDISLEVMEKIKEAFLKQTKARTPQDKQVLDSVSQKFNGLIQRSQQDANKYAGKVGDLRASLDKIGAVVQEQKTTLAATKNELTNAEAAAREAVLGYDKARKTTGAMLESLEQEETGAEFKTMNDERKFISHCIKYSTQLRERGIHREDLDKNLVDLAMEDDTGIDVEAIGDVPSFGSITVENKTLKKIDRITPWSPAIFRSEAGRSWRQERLDELESEDGKCQRLRNLKMERIAKPWKRQKKEEKKRRAAKSDGTDGDELASRDSSKSKAYKAPSGVKKSRKKDKKLDKKMQSSIKKAAKFDKNKEGKKDKKVKNDNKDEDEIEWGYL